MAQDDELADENRKALERASNYRPPVSEFGIAEEILAEIRDSIGVLNANLINVNATKGPPAKAPTPFPRPETARDRAKDRWAMEDAMDIIAKATPKDSA